MSCSFAGENHCVLSCGSQAAWKEAEARALHSFDTLQAETCRPTQVIWETTQACDLQCKYCRAKARPHRHPLELSTAEAFHLIDQIAKMQVPDFVLSGGDPLKRADILPIVQYACKRGVQTALTPSTSPLLVRDAVFNLKQSGLTCMAIGLDASTPELHDGYRGSAGSYKRSLDAIQWCHQADLSAQVNTTVSRHNFADLADLIELLVKLRVECWNVFFLVPTGSRQMENMLTAEEHEQAFAKLFEASRRVKFQISVTEGQHYRRFVLQQTGTDSASTTNRSLLSGAKRGITKGKDSVFVSHTGEVYPSAFLPLSAGNILWEPLSEIYENSQVFRSLRDSSLLKGKCGRCDFKEVCGGSRARAFAVSHDVLAEEPRCDYVPA